MSVRVSVAALGDIQKLFDWGAMGAWTDSQLVERFLAGREESEAAFRVLIQRHGPMVLGICRRILGDEHAAEDAFQATFLTLVKKARGLRDRGLLTAWLYGVATRVSHKERARGARRRVVERHVAERAPQIAACPEPGDLQSLIDEEIRRLPERYRLPLVLCHVEGLRHEEVARRIGCPVGTVESRLSRARERLRMRLARRGLAPSASAMAAMLRPPGMGAVRSSLVESTRPRRDEPTGRGGHTRRHRRLPGRPRRTGRGDGPQAGRYNRRRDGHGPGDHGRRPGLRRCGKAAASTDDPAARRRCPVAVANATGTATHAAGGGPAVVRHHDRRTAGRLAGRAADVPDPIRADQHAGTLSLRIPEGSERPGSGFPGGLRPGARADLPRRRGPRR